MAIVTQGVVPVSEIIADKHPKRLEQWTGFACVLNINDPAKAVERTRPVQLDSSPTLANAVLGLAATTSFDLVLQLSEIP